jgi:cytoskeletal protein RodZ
MARPRLHSMVAKGEPNQLLISLRMPTVAEQLRHAREQQNLNVYQVAEITKIRTDHIRALEAGEYDMFSAPVYIRGFVRTYAKALKLDDVQISSALDKELGQTEKYRDPPPLTNTSNGTLDFVMLQLSKLNWRIVMATIAAALVIILTASALRSRATRKIDPLLDLGPGIYQPADGQSGDLLPLPKS